MKHSEQFTAIAAALAAAAADFKPIEKNKTVEVKTRSGSSYTFRYATLDAIVAAVRPALSTNGLVLVQSAVQEEITHSEADGIRIDREELLETRLIHSSGEWLSNTTPVLVSDGENSAQAYGSAITYARRYGITQLLCVVADEDDDGNAAAGNVSRATSPGSGSGAASGRRGGGGVITEKQCGMLRAKLRAIKGDEAAFCVRFEVDAIEALPKARMDDALAAIDSKDPAILQGALGSSNAADPSDAQRLKAHDACVAKNLESLEFIRHHLNADGKADPDGELGPSLPPQAVDEWRRLTAVEQSDLWLAPSKGGWFTTAERVALRDAINAHPTSEQE